MESRSRPVDDLFAKLIESLEEDPKADLDTFLASHPEHAPALRERLEKLRGAGLLGSSWGDGNLLHEMRARFGVRSEIRTLRPSVSPGETVEQAGELLPSRIVGGRYRILGELGRGGMGRVFRALDVDLEREVALKVANLDEILPRADTAQKRAWIERFLAEAQVTAQLEHPSIVPLHDIGVDRTGQLYYTMKLVEGRTLAQCIDKWHAGLAAGQPFPMAECLRIVLQICNALAFAHERGVMHRDLKPSNVMVGYFGEVQVMDWGLAKLIGSQEALAPRVRSARTGSDSPTRVGQALGTPPYMAPEQAHGDSRAVDRRTDVYGIGAILHHSLYGVPPQQREDDTSEPWTTRARKRVAAELEAVCQRALHSDPALRYQSASDLAEDLQACLDQRVVKAYETGAVAELRKWIRRNRALATALGGAILILTAGFLTTLYLKEQAETRGDDVLRLSAVQDLNELLAAADRLWPPYPQQLPGLHSWMETAKPLVEDLPRHRAKLSELRSSDSREAQWWSTQLEKLATGLEDLEAGLMAEGATMEDVGWSIPDRVRFAESLSDGFREGGQYALAWERALPSIRAAYEGLEIEAQMGLIPLGPDPESGLCEFAHLQTGEPARRGADGKLELGEETGLVLVLIPGGTFWMGAQDEHRDGPNYDPNARSDEMPVHRVTLSPFFLSKYEMTQGQWLRSRGTNPSYYHPDNYAKSLLNPVEQVSWNACMETCGRLGLSLPSEAQWEYAARAKTSTMWSTGNDPESVLAASNLADQTARRAGTDWIEVWPESDDGYMVHASVNVFPANGFGLHNMHGNVWEWCRDGFDREFYQQGATIDPVSIPAGTIVHVFRGGSFADEALSARCSFRNRFTSESASDRVGLRPARKLER